MRLIAVTAFFIAVVTAGSGAIGCGSNPGPTAPGGAQLTGIVSDAVTKAPIAAATVTITGSGFAPYTVTANAGGAYTGAGIPPGEVTVTAKAAGYQDATKRITLVTGSNVLNIELNRTP